MTEDSLRKEHCDYALIFLTLALVMVGLLMVYSASAVLAAENFGDSYHFIKRQLVFVLAGVVAMMVGMKIRYQHYSKVVYGILILAMMGVVLTYIPGLRREVGGASRWIQAGPIAIQPSEFVKIAMVLFFAYMMDKKMPRIKEFGVGFLPVVLIASVVMTMILGQRDFGSAMVIGAVMVIMLFVAGTRFLYLGCMILSALPVLYVLIASVSYRRKRIMAFLDPWSDRYGSGFQIIQSLVSFHEGGLAGKGLGQGQQKLFYLPEAHTDFILSVLAEELGLIGVMVLLGLFLAFLWRGLRVAWRAPDYFGKFLATGIISLFAVEVLFNMMVVMGLFPTKGLALPFISYGGSSMVASMLLVGILLNISSYREARS